jgi:cytochrome c peroxidase
MTMPNERAIISRIKQDKTYVRLFSEVYDLNLNDIANSNQSNSQQSKKVSQVFQLVAKAISAYEQSPVFNKFNSKFDYVLAGKTQFTDQEAKGLAIFNGKANCAACHISEAAVEEDGIIAPPLFTDFSYDNIGLPRNINIPSNPEPNLGLGGRNDLPTDSAPNGLGKHKVMSLRNIALTAPYGHNGSMETLEQIVHFYNTKDILGYFPDIKYLKFGKPE